MVTCDVCGSENFEKHEGFMYCAVCQTQSQDYYEQEYEYQGHEVNVIRQHKSPAKSLKTKKENFYDDGLWTSWEGFNYILHGMLEEMPTCGVNQEFKEVAFRLWAAYLRECQVAFISKFEERVPKLRFKFKERDARLLYNAEVPLNFTEKRKSRSRSRSSRISNTSDSSISKVSLSFQKRKIITDDYQDHLSLSLQSNSNLADETLESLGKSSEAETSGDFSDGSESFVNSFKHMFSKKDFTFYKDSFNSKRLKPMRKDRALKDVRFPGKNRLLSIIHLASLMTASQMQLSDLLRFIRESQLSFAKVTHFFPNHVKFPKKDFSYMEVTSDSLMPTHLRQRRITVQLARLLRIQKIPTPDVGLLIDRYCQDLNLPKQVTELGQKIVEYWWTSAVPTSVATLPGFEAWAMAAIIFVMKLLFGLNDKTEIFLSQLATDVNSRTDSNLFVFKDWQEFIECRKTVLTNFHYPTQEQLNGSCHKSCKSFLDVIMKESKDEFRKDRFIPYPRYYIERDLIDGIKQTLNVLSKPQSVTSIEFQPSLTPQTSHTETIIMNVLGGTDTDGAVKKEDTHQPFPEKVLKRSFRNCDVQFALHPRNYLDSMGESSDSFDKFCIGCDLSEDVPKDIADVSLDPSSRYWIFDYPDQKSSQLSSFNEEVLEKTPQNFQWLLKECARMVEMNGRDVYTELLRLEKKLSPRMG